jgi:tRNA/tmRNA/rRNA uracil-C5-methylase (TrmA/RlmC/RlmD family)
MALARNKLIIFTQTGEHLHRKPMQKQLKQAKETKYLFDISFTLFTSFRNIIRIHPQVSVTNDERASYGVYRVNKGKHFPFCGVCLCNFNSRAIFSEIKRDLEKAVLSRSEKVRKHTRRLHQECKCHNSSGEISWLKAMPPPQKQKTPRRKSHLSKNPGRKRTMCKRL